MVRSEAEVKPGGVEPPSDEAGPRTAPSRAPVHRGEGGLRSQFNRAKSPGTPPIARILIGMPAPGSPSLVAPAELTQAADVLRDALLQGGRLELR